MKIACIYPRSLFSAWSVSEGIVDTLRRMGHEPLNCGIDQQAKQFKRSDYPSMDELNACDLIIVSGPEHIGKFVRAIYPEWDKVKTKKALWWHETIERADYGKLDVDGIKTLGDVFYTPAAQDEKFGLTWLPFGVDTEMFKPCWVYDNVHFQQSADWKHEACGENHIFGPHHCPLDRRFDSGKRDIDCAFIGLVYGPRQEFLKKLTPHLGDIKLTIGNCQVQDLSGVNIRKSVELYASELRRCKVLMNLPSLCRHTVTKIFEGAACGALVLTDRVEDERNLVDSAVYYETPEQCAERLRRFVSEGCTILSQTNCEEVHKNHRLDQRLSVILA